MIKLTNTFFLLLVLLWLGLLAGPAAAQDAGVQVGAGMSDAVPMEAYLPIDALNVRGADLRDLFRAIAAQYRINLVVDDAINRTVTVGLSDVTVIEAVRFLCDQYDLELERTGSIFHVRPRPAVERLPQITVRDSLLTLDLSGDDVHVVARLLSERTGKNVIVRQGVAGTLSGYLQDVSFDAGLRTLLLSNGFALREQDGIYAVDRAGSATIEGGAGSYWVQVRDGMIDLDVADAAVLDVLRDVAGQMQLDLVTYGLIEGRITAKWSGLTLDQTLTYLLKGTNLAYRREGNVFIVGDKQTTGISNTKMIRLRHIRSEGLVERLPDNLRQRATFQTVREQNGLVVIGSNDAIAETEEYLAQIDRPTPQILIEALVVDFDETDVMQLGVTFGRDGQNADGGGYIFGGGDDQTGGYVLERGGRGAQNVLDFWSDVLGVGSIGRLPSDFYFRLQAVVREGKAVVRSRPQIATLNGHTANISVGTTQYYILKSVLPYPVPGQTAGEVEHFERVEANVTLEITPWVTASGEVTAEISPSFATPVGALDPSIPPTINNREVNTTVRLRDGETVIIGGLIQETQVDVYNKVPLLGSLPVLGQLFRNRRHDIRKSELVIFITPHVFYGDETDIATRQGIEDDLRAINPSIFARP